MPVQVEERESKIYFADFNDQENEKINEELKTLSKRAEVLASLFLEWLDSYPSREQKPIATTMTKR